MEKEGDGVFLAIFNFIDKNIMRGLKVILWLEIIFSIVSLGIFLVEKGKSNLFITMVLGGSILGIFLLRNLARKFLASNYFKKLKKGFFIETLDIREDFKERFDECFWEGSYEISSYSKLEENINKNKYSIPEKEKLNFWLYKLKNNRQRILTMVPVFAALFLLIFKYTIQVNLTDFIENVYTERVYFKAISDLLLGLLKWGFALTFFHSELEEVNKTILRIKLLLNIKDSFKDE